MNRLIIHLLSPNNNVIIISLVIWFLVSPYLFTQLSSIPIYVTLLDIVLLFMSYVHVHSPHYYVGLNFLMMSPHSHLNLHFFSTFPTSTSPASAWPETAQKHKVSGSTPDSPRQELCVHPAMTDDWHTREFGNNCCARKVISNISFTLYVMPIFLFQLNLLSRNTIYKIWTIF